MGTNSESRARTGSELAELRQRVAELEALLDRRQQAEEESLRERERFSIARQDSDMILAHEDPELVLSQHLVASQEAERCRIALELHDEIGQLLTGVKLTLERSTRAPSESTRDHLIREAQHLIGDLMERVRNISMELRPKMLDDLGLLPTMEWYVHNYSELTSITVALDSVGVQRRFPPEVETAAYRISQEALTNIARHARVDQARLTIRASEGNLMIQVEDHGAGFNPHEISPFASNGLSGMRERVRLLGGRFTLNSAPGQGTCLTAELPVKPGA